MAKIVGVSISKSKHTKKENKEVGILIENFGLKDDAHAGEKIRQVSLLAIESIDKMKEKLPELKPGDFAENITTEGINLLNIKIGEKLKLGPSAIIEVKQKGKECKDRCEIFYKVGDCIMPKEGVFAKVIKSGKIKIGDEIKKI